jgi:ankyrin repeat protein
MMGRTDEVKKLLDADPGLANARGAHDIPVLFHAATCGNLDVAQMLLDAGCKHGFNFALHGAINYGHVDMVKWLLEHGVKDATTKDFQGKTPLDKAREKEQQEIIQLLEAFQPAVS